MDSGIRKSCQSLQLLCQIEVIRILHGKASTMEAEYIDRWCSDLTCVNQSYERNLDIRTSAIDTSQVVREFTSTLVSGLPVQGSEGSRRTKRSYSGSAKNKKSLLKGSSYSHGIPPGVSPKEYILYRKCKYIEDIRATRKMLMDNLSASAMNGLMNAMYNISLFNNKQEHGLLTLQSMLTTELVSNFCLASPKVYVNFSRESGMETSIATTILHYTLSDSSRLVHLNLDRCGCDSLLLLLSKVAKNLKILQISGSLVSDAGLLHLCGVEKEPVVVREKLNRSCKKDHYYFNPASSLVLPKYRKIEGAGCTKLEHLEAFNLMSVNWNIGKMMHSFRTYKDTQVVPFDSGFVAALTFLPNLKVFLTEVGCRAIHSYLRKYRKSRKRAPTLAVEIVSENNLTPTLMTSVQSLCPELKEIRVAWHDLFTLTVTNREDWFDQLAHLRKISSIRCKEIDFRSNKFSNSLSSIGKNFTVLDFSEVRLFRYSTFRSIKQFCPNLRELTVAMQNKNLFSATTRIEVDKDSNLELFPDTNFKLRHLEKLHLSGPFGNTVCKFLMQGADSISSLTLGIEWLDQAFFPTQPEGRSDYISKEYLEEILTVNKLAHLEELHLFSQYRRGRSRLNKDCAEFVLEKFPKLTHLGNFLFWNMTRAEKNTIIAKTRSCNRDITFDEDLFANVSSGDATKFEYRYIENRQKFACRSFNLKRDSSEVLSDFLEVLAGPPELFPDDNSDASSSDGNWSDDDLEDNVIQDAEPFCVIM